VLGEEESAEQRNNTFSGDLDATMTPKLSILTPAIWRRIDKTRELAELIAPHPRVEHVVILDNMTRSVGLKRQACLDSAIGDYIMFVDDDDGIFPDTIPLILAAIKHAPDVITFKQAASYNGKESQGEKWMPH
jgi:glycosyltransferase involved in cell wall biosynthesis